jgi:hypothetical protein
LARRTQMRRRWDTKKSLESGPGGGLILDPTFPKVTNYEVEAFGAARVRTALPQLLQKLSLSILTTVV